jgi:type II secretory pathway pseudopilin PulG
MFDDADPVSVEAAVPAAIVTRKQAARLPPQRSVSLKRGGCSRGPARRSPWPAVAIRRRRLGEGGFTLAELLVSVGVIVIIVLLASQLLKSAATVTTLAHKRMDADSQARQVLDRMAVDFAQMVKRSDVDYYLKSAAAAPLRSVNWPDNSNLKHNDKIGFYSGVPGYYPSIGSKSPVSLVAYRINTENKLERMGKGLVWNAVSTDTPVVFMPIPVASPIPVGELPDPAPNPLPAPAWPEIATSGSSWSDSEVIGPQVFRFEYYYLLKGQTDPTTSTTYSPLLTDTPWDTRISSCCSTSASTLCCHTAPEGMQDVAAIVVDVAVIDPKSRSLITDCQLAQLNGAPLPPGCPQPPQYPVLIDYAAAMTPGQLLAQWRAALDANAVGLPLPAISGIRVYERYMYLSPPTLLTP